MSGPLSVIPVEQHRCECGSLLAKMAPEGIEVKCRRCKRIVLIRFADIEGMNNLHQGGEIEAQTRVGG
jgi:phage FluMu protein Com